ncbi:MAG: ADP-ribosylglycohydrolase family protein [Vulcanimicrobiota bacterium]
MTRDSILGCILGGAIGDAAASAWEGAAPGKRSWRNQEWRLSDDTQLTLATCEALTASGPRPEAVAERMLSWYRERRLSGLGSSTLKALRDLQAGGHWAMVGRGGAMAAGNGAAMRVAPLAFIVDPATAQGRLMIRDICRITHHSEQAYAGALAVVTAIRGGDMSSLPDSLVRDRLEALSGQALTMSELAQGYGCSGFVAESIPLAIYASQQVERLGFQQMLDQLISAGGDTDTNSSIACQIAGSRLGLARLPSDLLDRLPRKAEILDIAGRFAEAQG